MLGDPSTPLFSITAFISLDPNQVRAFDTSATSWRITTSLGSSGLRNTLPFVIPADVRSFSCQLERHALKSLTLKWTVRFSLFIGLSFVKSSLVRRQQESRCTDRCSGRPRC